jgi:hypothetical protein
MITEKQFQERNKRLLKMGLKPVYKSLAEKKKAVRQMNKLAKDAGYGAGIDQARRELLK